MPYSDLLQPLAMSFRDVPMADPRVASIVEVLARGDTLDRDSFERLLGVRDPASEASLCDFLLHCIAAFLSDHSLSVEEKSAIRYLWRLFQVSEGHLARVRGDRVGQLLAVELGRMLEDRRIDAAEALHQVDLQEVFGLGYDQYLELTKPHVFRVLLSLLDQIDPDKDRVVSEEDLAWYHRQLVGLDTAFNLNPGQQQQGPEAGFIYVLVNPSMPGIVKIGKTTRSPIARARELGSASGVPTPFMLIYHLEVVDCQKAEQYVHERLEAAGRRVAGNREFFSVAPTDAIVLVQESKFAAMAV